MMSTGIEINGKPVLNSQASLHVVRDDDDAATLPPLKWERPTVRR